MFIPSRGASLLIQSGPPHDLERKHLFIVLTIPISESQSDSKKVVLACVSSYRYGCDTSCILRLGDHPFIKHCSFVDYAKTRLETTEKLLSGVNQNTLQPLAPVNEKVIVRICQGLESSKHLPKKIHRFYKLASKPT